MKIFRWIGNLFVPMFARPQVAAAIIWFFHLLLVAGAAVGLYFLADKYALARNLGGPVWFRPFWLPALFLLGYGLLWMAWFIWRLMSPDSQVSYFPELDELWGTILDALDGAGIGIGDTPIYLVIGPVTGSEEEWLSAIPGGLVVQGATPSGSAIRAFASREMIIITCPGVSLLGSGIKLETVSAGASAFDVNGSIGAEGMAASIGIDGGASIGLSVGGDLQTIQKMIRRARDENRSLSEQEKREIQRISGSPVKSSEPKGADKPALVRDPTEIETRRQKLAHVCRLVSSSRWPLCPLNGAIFSLPISRLEREDIAQQLGLNAAQDIQVAEETLKLSFPNYALITGINTLPGATDFLTKFAVDRKSQRLGKGFPLAPDLKPDRVAEAAFINAKWILNSLLPYWSFRQFQIERAGESHEPITKTNGEIFQFLNAVRQRADAVGHFVGRAASCEGTRFGGCYLTAKLQEFGNTPLFMDEFFKKVVSTQGAVAWTDAAYAEDANYRAATRFGYLILFGIIGAVLTLAAYVIYTVRFNA